MSNEYKSPQRLSAHLKGDMGGLSCEVITLEGGAFGTGTVVGLLSNGNYTHLDLAVDATEAHEAKAIVWGSVDATDGPMPAKAHVRLCEVYEQFLHFPEATTDEQKEAFLAQLANEYVIAR